MDVSISYLIPFIDTFLNCRAIGFTNMLISFSFYIRFNVHAKSIFFFYKLRKLTKLLFTSHLTNKINHNSLITNLNGDLPWNEEGA